MRVVLLAYIWQVVGTVVLGTPAAGLEVALYPGPHRTYVTGHLMFTAADSPTTATIYEGPGQISAMLQLKQLQQQLGPKQNTVQVSIFHHDELANFLQASQHGHVCCTISTTQGHGCIVEGEGRREPILVRTFVPIFRRTVAMQTQSHSHELAEVLTVKRTGVHYLALTICTEHQTAHSNSSAILITGNVHWRNPHGHFPGELYRMFEISLAVVIAHALLLVVWMVLAKFAVPQTGVAPQQWHIGLLLLCSAVDAFSSYFGLLVYNHTGLGTVPTVADSHQACRVVLLLMLVRR